MNILIAANQKVFMGTRVFLHSLIMHNDNLLIYLMYSDISKKNIKKLITDVDGFNKNCKLIPIYIEESIFDNVPVSKRISKEAYFRLLALDYLPSTCDKVLYLDTDIIVNKNLNVLYFTDIDSFYAAAVEDPGMCKETKIRKEVFDKIGFSLDEFYFNSGVMLFNLSLMRENFSRLYFEDFIRDNYDKITYHDQDVLNICLHGKVLALDEVFNCRCYLYDTSEEQNILERAYIIHYGKKPWNLNFDGICGEVFWENAVEIYGKRKKIIYEIRRFFYKSWKYLFRTPIIPK